MPTQGNELVQHLRQALLPQDEAGLTDGQLLGQFIEHRNEAAIAVLVRRHGPMVWGVCRRILANHQDAEDAFQATFLVLVRKARSVRRRDMVGNWLYGVANQTARKARAMAAKRRTRERQVTPLPEVREPADSSAELELLLDQELSRLPDKYRTAIVLCDLEGKTRKEAARQQHGGMVFTLPGIYSLEGDRLRICIKLDDDGKGAPNDFRSIRNSMVLLLELRPQRREAAPPPARRIPSAEVVTQHLRQKYPEQGDRSDGHLRLVPGTKVTEVASPLLRQQLPRTHFYLTKLATDCLEYLEVPLLAPNGFSGSSS
jgi:RNA polymerase sigma factor (sigma-70 family)